MEKKRNGALCFWAFIFSMVLVIHYAVLLRPEAVNHYPLVLYRGELGLLFFFLFAGILLARHIDSLPDDRFEWGDLWSYIKGLLKRYLPALCIIWAIAFVTVNIVYFNDAVTLINNFFASLLELLPIRNAGFFLKPLTTKSYVGSRVMDQAWVFSAIILAILILYPLYRKNKERFEAYIAPVAAMLLIGYVFFKDGGLVTDKARSLSSKYFFYSFKSTFIALGVMCLGVVCYRLSQTLKQKPLSKKAAVLLSVIEIVCYLGVIVYMQYYRFFARYADLLALVAIAVGITISYSRKGALSRVYDNKVFYFFGRFSLYPFLTFTLFAKILPVLMPTAGTLRLELIYIGLTLLSALVLMALEKPFIRLVKASKKLFVKSHEKETA